MDISVVIPVYNGAGQLVTSYHRFKGVLDKLQKDYEIIFVDDGSRDRSFEVLVDLHQKDKRVKIIRLAENSGQQTALFVGLGQACGRIILPLDQDSNISPVLLSTFLKTIEQGYDMVIGHRVKRNGVSLVRKTGSFLFNKFMDLTTGIKLHDRGCPLKAFKRERVEQYREVMKTHSRFGVYLDFPFSSICELKINCFSDTKITKYSFFSLLRIFLDFSVEVLFRSFGWTMPVHSEIGEFEIKEIIE